eukprot:7105300-Prymnesium_polylepis.1
MRECAPSRNCLCGVAPQAATPAPSRRRDDARPHTRWRCDPRPQGTRSRGALLSSSPSPPSP